LSKARKVSKAVKKVKRVQSPSTVERKAQILMKLRGYELIKQKQIKDYSGFLAQTADKKKMLIWCLPSPGTIGVQYIKNLRKAMDEEELDRAIVVTNGRYTQAARKNAQKGGIELIPKIFPSFNIFDHVLVPIHEIVEPDERKKLLHEYRVQPYQLPLLKASDPAVMAIGAKPGDIVRVIRDSPTAGKYVSYRHVVED
jgi:DNA-directed RNA polymerase subunit H